MEKRENGQKKGIPPLTSTMGGTVPPRIVKVREEKGGNLEGNKENREGVSCSRGVISKGGRL